MGCFQSKNVETLNSEINTVLKLGNTDQYCFNKHDNGEEAISIADKIKNNRKQKKASGDKSNKVTKYDPKIVAKYEIKGIIGKGKFSTVLRVENKMSRNPFALKILDKVDGLETLENEINILRRVIHGQVLKIIEVFMSQSKKVSTTTAVVMELATGGDLFDRLFSSGAFPEREARKVLSQVLCGVGYLHSIGITHRDLKPNNILFYRPGKDSKVLITDFGMAHTRRCVEDVYMRDVCGTPEYLAPEVVARQPYTQAVDLWASGVIMFIIVRCKFPFPVTSDKVKLFRAIVKADYCLDDEDWLSCSAACRELVALLMSRHAGDRPTADQALNHQWIRTRHKGERNGSCSSSSSSIRSLQQLRSASSVRLSTTSNNSTRHKRHSTRKSTRRKARIY